ncbi:MAG: hypothetical protein L0Y64_26180, partial [Myxococcaceae bacterium]|nr:hypothetical protein [Myxococcaceae bacterium]
NGTALVVTSAAGELRATLPAALLATAPAGNAATVVVSNPAPGGGSASSVFGVASRVSTLSADVQPLFAAQCASSGCHRTGSSTTPALEEGVAYEALVGVPSTACAPRLLVRACDPTRAGSVLIDKVLATPQSPACSGSPMPKGAPLTAAERQALVDWVAQGAPR